MSTLDEIKINLEGIAHALSDGFLAVPIYQRSYAWEDRHVNELFQDIATAIVENENEYFLGSIVVTQNTADRPEVVDGQQRLATTTILLAAIRDYFYGTGDKQRAESIESKYLLTRDLRTQELIPKLRLNDVDHDFFSRKILTPPGSPERKIEGTKDSHKRIERAAELAAKQVKSVAEISSKPIDRLIDWVDYVDAKARVIWVRVPDHANAFTIFETLNDRGLDLAISDLLKNYLFHLAGDRIAEVQKRWTLMQGTLEAVESDGIIIDYIRHFWSSNNGLTRERDLYERIKRQITSKQKSVDFATELADNARVYAAILNTNHEMWKKYGSTAKAHMETLNLMGMIQIRPLLLALLDKFSVKEMKKSLKFLVATAVRFLIYGGLGGGTLENQYALRAKDVRDGSIKTATDLLKAMSKVVPTDSQFNAAFTVANVSKNYLARYYLRVLEKQVKGETDPELIPNPNEEEVNLEHILPQTPSKDWKHIDNETAKAFYRRLGNMALLKGTVNSSLGNIGFADKQKEFTKSVFQLTSNLKNYSSWGPKEIEQRQAELAKLAVKAWPNKV